MAEVAERVVVELEARNGAFNASVKGSAATYNQSMSQIERSASRAEAAIQRQAQVVVVSAGQQANATRNLGRQIADVGSSLASGSSPFLILAQQAPQVADALAGTQGAAGRVAAFFAGPWGAALLAAASVAGVLVGKLLEAESAADKKRDAFAELTKAIEDSIAANRSAIDSEQRAISLAQARAQIEFQAAVAIRERTKAQLALARANLEGARAAALNPSGGLTPEERTGALGASAGFEGQARRLAALQAEQDAAVRRAQQSVSAAGARRIQQSVSEELDRATAATARYDRAVDRLNRRLERGQVTEAQYRDEITRLAGVRDRSLESIRASERAESRAGRSTRGRTEAERDKAKALREAAKAEKDLAQTLDDITRRYDPATAAAKTYAQTINDIYELEAKGQISLSEAALLAQRAAAQESKRVADDLKQRSSEILGFTDTDFGQVREQADRAAQIRSEAEIAAAERTRQLQEENVRELAFLYEDLLTGGVDSVWDTFKREGFRAIAEVLARWTASQFNLPTGGGGTGLFGSLLTSAIGGLFGRASGGYVAPGQLYRVNEAASPGRVEGFRPAGSGTIIPLGQMNQAVRPAGMTVVQNITVDARNSVNPAGFEQRILAQANQFSARAAATAGQQALRQMPQRLSQYQTDGT